MSSTARGGWEHLEGRQAVLAALAACQRRFQAVLIRAGMHQDKLKDVLDLAAQRRVPVRFVQRAELDALTHGATHGGILAIASPRPRLSAGEVIDLVQRMRTAPLLLVLEGVDDARNLGFTLRTADALGVHAVLIKKHLWDFDPVEIARPSAGAYERIPLAQIEDVDVLLQLRKRGLRLIGLLARARRCVQEIDLRGPAALVIGGEKRGISGAVRGACSGFGRIQMSGGGSSLPLSHAAAIVIAEAARQRSAALPPPAQ